MEAVLMILLFSVFAILSDRLESKKKKRQTSAPSKEIPFEIPEIGRSAETGSAPVQEPPEPAIVLDGQVEKYRAYLAQDTTTVSKDPVVPVIPEEKTAGKVVEAPVNLQPGTILQAMAYKEIFDRPRAWNRIDRRRR